MLDSLSNLGQYVFTYGGTQFFMGFATLVLLPWLYFKVIKRRFDTGMSRFVAALVTWGVLWIVAYGDVFYIGWQAQQLCRAEAGPHVYRTAEADGFLGSGDIVDWASYGFKFVEYQSASYTRMTLKGNKPFSEHVETPISKYEYLPEFRSVTARIVRNSWIIRDRSTLEILGEKVSFAIYPGWVDSAFLSFTGFTFVPPICVSSALKPTPGATTDSQDIIKRVLKPN